MITRYILAAYLLTLSLNVCAQRILKSDYYMVSVDDSKLFHQSNDTLYQYKCSPDLVKLPKIKASSHYKILNVKIEGSISIIKLEKLDTIALTTDPYPLKRYYVLVLKNINDKTAEQLMLYRGLSKNELDNVLIPDLSGKFFGTLLSENYKQDLLKFKSIAGNDDANVIIKDLKSAKYSQLVEKYEATDLNDMYAASLSAEILYRACVDNGYNPINAAAKISALIKQK